MNSLLKTKLIQQNPKNVVIAKLVPGKKHVKVFGKKKIV